MEAPGELSQHQREERVTTQTAFRTIQIHLYGKTATSGTPQAGTCTCSTHKINTDFPKQVKQVTAQERARKN